MKSYLEFESDIKDLEEQLAKKNRKLLEFRENLQKKLIFGTEIEREKKLILKNIQIFWKRSAI